MVTLMQREIMSLILVSITVNSLGNGQRNYHFLNFLSFCDLFLQEDSYG